MNKPPLKKKTVQRRTKNSWTAKEEKNRGIVRQNLNIGPNFTFFLKNQLYFSVLVYIV
jgi:hypothetical protein